MAGFVVVRKNKPVQSVVAWLVAILTVGYMLPWAIAATRGKINSGAIFWLNLLLGWTVVGWIIALVMSVSAHQAVAGRIR
jgi:Superinfection immunity protein